MAVRSEVEPSLPVQEEPMASSLPLVSEPALQQPAVGIPPIAFEPEMPALPRLRQDAGSSASQEAPIEVAKVMPHETEPAEIITETLEAALSDIYFDYDRFAIRDDAMQVLKANAELLLAKFADANIVIEGHCDERGTQSYNMVLGERRAKAVKSFLEDLGASAENLQVVSFGKDKPFCQEQTEECWQENRRGHFVIK
jgi:peptidoglycan-associated lipoprotein